MAFVTKWLKYGKSIESLPTTWKKIWDCNCVLFSHSQDKEAIWVSGWFSLGSVGGIINPIPHQTTSCVGFPRFYFFLLSTFVRFIVGIWIIYVWITPKIELNQDMISNHRDRLQCPFLCHCFFFQYLLSINHYIQEALLILHALNYNSLRMEAQVYLKYVYFWWFKKN